MPRAQTILAFDFGTRRVGIAIGNTLTGAARPLETLDEPVQARRFERIGRLLGEWHPDALVVGRPLQPDGQANAVTLAAERFARQLQGRFGLPVALVDERFSTVAARERIRQSGVETRRGPRSGPSRASGSGMPGRDGPSDDAAAAAVILEQFLESRAHESAVSSPGGQPETCTTSGEDGAPVEGEAGS